MNYSLDQIQTFIDDHMDNISDCFAGDTPISRRCIRYGYRFGIASIFIPYNKEIGIKVTTDKLEYETIVKGYEFIHAIELKNNTRIVPIMYDHFTYYNCNIPYYFMIQERVRPILGIRYDSLPSGEQSNISDKIGASPPMLRKYDILYNKLEKCQISFHDDHYGNVGFDRHGELLILDTPSIQ